MITTQITSETRRRARPGRPNPITAAERRVIKRDGRECAWDASKITRAIALAFYDVHHNGAPNPHREDAAARFGLDPASFLKAVAITERVSQMLELYYRRGQAPTIEQIQDTVEMAIAAESEWAVARSYIIYRERKAELRLHRHEENGLADYIAAAKYARFRPDLGRREIFTEAVNRVADMHREFFRDKLDRRLAGDQHPAEVRDVVDRHLANRSLSEIIDSAFEAVARKRVLPSMRSLQFGGVAVLRNHARLYNCAYSPIDRPEYFREYFFLLLAGVGCGFSVQKHHVDRIPPIPARPSEYDLPIVHHTVADSIEGWSEALDTLLKSFYERHKVEFNFSLIRPRGTPLVTAGGRAPGHLPLKRALGEVEKVLLGAAGRKLRPIEVYDICMYVARAVLAGGVRRSATICLFSPDDEEMMSAKTGEWFERHPQRSASNNSAVLSRDSANEERFRKLFVAQKEYGEPGFYFANDPEYGCNPCCEIGLHPVISGRLEDADRERLRQLGMASPPAEGRLSGWQMCNLTTINGDAARDEQTFYEACVHAAVIGTLQAAYTDIPMLGPVSRFLNERDALLGISICGLMDNPELLLDPAVLERGATVCRAANRLVAAAIGIRPAARLTCVKPEGTASLLLGAGSGIHPHHARRYFRRVQANRKDPVYRHFHAVNPQMTERSVYHPDTDDVITFPVEAPEEAILRDELGAVEFLDWVRLVQRHWVRPGTADLERSPGLHHNVSNTCTARDDEWDAVENFIWENREDFTGIALLRHDGDKRYAQAPREAVSTEEDVVRWNRLRYRAVDYTQLKEEQDSTEHQQTAACAGGACEIV